MNNERLYFLDNLRAAIIFSVILLHAAICYMTYAPSWWYVLNPETSLFFTSAVILIDVPIMPAMFFIAGYFALPSLRKQGPARFMTAKFRRIFLPWLIGVLFLAPPTAFLIYFSRNVPMDLLTFWTGEFWTKAFQQSVYWFLGVLFAVFALFAGAYQMIPALREAPQKKQSPSFWLFGLLLAVSTLAFFLVIQSVPVDGWFVSYLLTFQPERLPLFLLYFSAGVYAWYCGWFTPEGYSPRKRIWVPLFFVSAAMYLAVKMGYGAPEGPFSGRKDLLALAFNAYCLFSVVGLIALFSRFVNQKGRLWNSAASNSYGIYFVHPLVVYWTAYWLLSVDGNLYVKAAAVALTGCVMSWLLSAYGLKKAPILRKMF